MISSKKVLSELGDKLYNSIKKELLEAPTRQKTRFKGAHKASGALLAGLNVEVVEISDHSYELVITAPGYAEELDEGQTGLDGKVDSPNSFDATVTDIKNWLAFKNWKPLGTGNVGSKHQSKQTIAGYAKSLQKRLQYVGVKPTYFLTNPLKEVLTPQAYNRITSAYADDLLELTLDKLEQNGWKK